MNYTGNPRHLRGGLHSRSSQRVLRLRHTPAILERPWLDICRTFQKQTECRTARPSGGVAASSAVALSTTSSMEDGRDCFQTKRRRLLEQSDWLGLELAAPINVSKPSALSPPFDGVTKFVTKKRYTSCARPRNRSDGQVDHSFDLCFLNHLILQRSHRCHEVRPPFPLDLLRPHLIHPHPVVLKLPSHPSAQVTLAPRLLSRLIIRLP